MNCQLPGKEDALSTSPFLGTDSALLGAGRSKIRWELGALVVYANLNVRSITSGTRSAICKSTNTANPWHPHLLAWQKKRTNLGWFDFRFLI